MNTHVAKIHENKSQFIADNVSEKKSVSKSNSNFIDNQPEAVAQRKLQHMANNSFQAKQAAQLQAMANNYSVQQQRPISDVSKSCQLKRITDSNVVNNQSVIQRIKIERKGINGLTHLVQMTNEGHIYNKDEWYDNEREEVSSGDMLLVDTDNAWYSHRGINQEVNWQRDGQMEQDHLWLEAVGLNNEPLPNERFVREEMLIDPIMVLMPRNREGLDGSIKSLSELLMSIGDSKCQSIVSSLAAVKRGINITNAPEPVDLNLIGTEVERISSEIERIGKEYDSLLSENLDRGANNLRESFASYNIPKKEASTGGKLGRLALQRLGVKGIDIGGTGLTANFLDVNIDDSVNNKNHLVLGDAMNLAKSFEPDCIDKVIAQLLPVVDMEESHTVEARIKVIASVLAGVNYISPTGIAEIKFNDNSDPGRVNERQLLELAETYRFTLEKQFPARQSLLFGELLNNKKFQGQGEKSTKKTDTTEGLYRFFTFSR